MKHKKEFFGVLFSVLISVFLIGIVVYATTTISTNIVTGGTVAIGGAAAATELGVIGTASISEDLWASGSFQFGAGEATGTVSYSRLGAGTTGHSLSDADDLLITGLLEVDDVAYFDSNVSLSDSATLKIATILGHTDAGEYLRIGDQALTSHSFDTQDDLLVTGDMEVDGTAWFDGAVSVSGSGLILDNGASITTGLTSPSAACVIGSLYIDTVLGTISMCDANGDWSPITVQ